MPIAPGSRLGPYEIVTPLGAGGMGEVYKARDTRLGREVAIKVLPANRVSDPDRKARFIQEARAASSLNHPNIVIIHDIAESGGVDFLVMELIAGKTLDKLIGPNGLPAGEVLRYALTLADALAKAHAAGIVHCDLKPANVMITHEGVLKVLDFGLAKLAETGGGAEGGATVTIERTVLGTIAYMSPEQAEGKPVDARTDIFSFGCVLYEMLTGQRAFTGDTQASTLAEGASRDLTRIIQRCMRRDPARRFQHMVDVKVELEELKEESESGARTVATPAARPPRRWARWAAVVALVLALACVAVWFRLRPESGAAALAPVPLVTDAGIADSPSFSPDGNQVAYSWDGEKQDNHDIYVRLIGSGKPLRLTTDPAPDLLPAWSPDGRAIAFIRGGSAIYLVSPLGGGERKVAEGTFPGNAEALSGLSWSPDSKFLAVSAVEGPGQSPSIYTVRLEDGEKRRLTTPAPATRDFQPAISPDGRRLAFARCAYSYAYCGIYVVDLAPDYRAAGAPRLLGTAGGAMADPAWTADGKDIVYLFAPAGGNYHLMRIRAAPGAGPQRMTFAGDHVFSPAVSVRGNRLAYAVNLSDIDLRLIEPGKAARSIVPSTRSETSPQFSPDGTRIAFASDRTGVSEVWVCDQDGANPAQWTHFGDRHSGTPRWSPDGRSIAFDSQTKEGWRIFVMAADSGQSHRLTSEQAIEAIPSWSADGQTIYFASNRTGRDEIWKVPSAGGKSSQVTRNGGYVAFESRDGRRLYYAKDSGASGLWVQPVEGGPEKRIVESLVSRGFAVEDDGVYYLSGLAAKGEASIRFYRFATGQSQTAARIEDRGLYLGLAVSPDRTRFLYSGYTRVGQNLMLVEGFK
ncbi:Serine/threonine protein kinase [Candidatus Sulfopaludibacter sp. SbA4]|nr:Serine/threonine protein kinase [Candidatus Sulfopaludibacter sp. SbA4]